MPNVEASKKDLEKLIGKKLNIKPLSKVDMVVEGDRLVIYPLAAANLRGIGRKVADGIDATDYIAKLRREWDPRP